MKALCFGSLNIDYVYQMDHHVRPGETLASKRMDIFCGGKGLNQSIAVAMAGEKIAHAGKIGNEGMMLKNFLEEKGVDASFVEVCDQPTGHAIIQVDPTGQNSIFTFGGTNKQLERAHIDRVISQFELGDILILQNEINENAYIMEKAHQQGMRIALNPSPLTDALQGLPMEYVTWFFVNEIEGKELTGYEEPEQILTAFREKYPNSAVVLTLGEDGSVYQDANETYRQGIYKVTAVDTTAAGDTFMGYFLAQIMKGRSPKVGLEMAAKASGIAVSRQGAATSIPGWEEVEG